MSPPALLTKLKVGIGKILLGNIFRILKSRYPSVSRFSSKFLGKYDTSVTHIKRKYRTIERVTPVNFLEQRTEIQVTYYCDTHLVLWALGRNYLIIRGGTIFQWL